jgi:hypothetical protein
VNHLVLKRAGVLYDRDMRGTGLLLILGCPVIYQFTVE